ncbi:hypothetical protein EO087_02695 [Dyella sp. M7H15-1]|uniref:hypothetical protein n=1 Tax=Dyella sp. M7H15-1 TaxID=2501295 RepID=UPI001004F41A|nr:hypothetical protein [Dyella sp. M7H15-1]QAU23033.1 hypothetical protein EO087_02695 [Dyella sp. M7H15-1]
MQVEQGLAEADDPNTENTEWVPHDVVKDNMQRQREALKACTAVAEEVMRIASWSIVGRTIHIGFMHILARTFIPALPGFPPMQAQLTPTTW